MKKLVLLIILLLQLILPVWAQSAFLIKDIRFEGLQRTPVATAENYLPIRRGQVLKPSDTGLVLRSLYQTGFFDRITLSREGNTLIIHVVERPTIGQLKVTGNSIIPTDKLTSVLKSFDIAEGRVYNPATVERITKSLLSQYYQLGHYNARVDVSVTPMSRNRVFVKINISEGVTAKIKRITIIGNHVFSEKVLVKQLEGVSTSGLFSFITQTDRYSEEKLDLALEKLRDYYLNHGYLRFEVKSAQAQVTPDRKAVYITIVVNEGDQYTVKSFDVTGNYIVPKEEILKQIHIRPGEIFSKQKVVDAEKNITDVLGNKGYMFAKVSVRPQINDQTKQITLLFNIDAGKRAYVRHITFTDNNHTNDVVLRREMLQMEAAPVSTNKLEESKHRLTMLPYIKDAEMSVNPVPNTDDQVDVNYKVTEENSGSATFKIGYSQLYHTILGVGFNQKNFLGTGKTFGVDLSRSRYQQFYTVDFTDPYYTIDGISRSFDFSFSKLDPRAAGVSSNYTSNEYDAGVLYSIPIGQETSAFDRFNIGFGYQDTIVNLNTSMNKVANQVSTFINKYGRHFQELNIKLGFSRDSRDRAIFPTRGSLQTLYLDNFAPLSSSSLAFYMLNYSGKWYWPITDQFIIIEKTDLGYGSTYHGARDFPFFRNYYGGGINSVRGYTDYTLGPRDSNDNPYGGNVLADASLGLIFPNYISDNLRTTVFLDAGNVYSSTSNKRFGGLSSNSGPIRFSVGIEADLMTPFGPIELSLAKPINARGSKPNNPRRGDDTQPFQFALGANF